MKLLLGLLLIIGGICGIAIGFLGNVTVDIPYIHPEALEMSLGFAVFSIIVFLGGLYTAFLNA